VKIVIEGTEKEIAAFFMNRINEPKADGGLIIKENELAKLSNSTEWPKSCLEDAEIRDFFKKEPLRKKKLLEEIRKNRMLAL
jgi:hypothetical protein